MATPTEFYPPGYLGTFGVPLITAAMLTPPLYGIGVAQVAYYYRSFPDDPVYIKLVVGILFLLDTTHIICQLQSTYEWFIIKLLGPIMPILFCVGLVLTYTIIFIVQCSYAARLYILSNKNKFVAPLVGTNSRQRADRQVPSCLLPVINMSRIQGVDWAINLIQTQNPNVTQTSRSFEISGKIELSCSLMCDVLIAGAMVYFLRAGRGNNTIRRTSEVVNSIIMYSISVGLFISVATALNLALWLALPENFIFVVFHLLLSKLYVNSLLVMLNSRVKLRRHLYAEGNDQLEF
ncbi:hypothetical protein C8R46DRAFT_118582 [Mycena filopes]|nr:hypothetical protein C8R46DRAFT_118582 [Mycena filopes]